MRGHRALYRGLRVSPVDLGDSPCKLSVIFNGWDLLEKVDANIPLPNVIGWVSRMILVWCV
jgi:hypothetical protein